MIAGPRDYPPLDVEQEWRKLCSALQELEEAGLVILERLQPATLSALQRRLRQGACHILHFVGHGAFDEATQDGVCCLKMSRDGPRGQRSRPGRPPARPSEPAPGHAELLRGGRTSRLD